MSTFFYSLFSSLVFCCCLCANITVIISVMLLHAVVQSYIINEGCVNELVILSVSLISQHSFSCITSSKYRMHFLIEKLHTFEKVLKLKI